MTAQEIVKATLDTLNVIFSWPVVILILVFMFRKRVEEAIGALTARLRSISVAGATAEFDSALELINSRSDVVEDAEDIESSQEVDPPDDPTDEAEIREFGQRIENLRK